MKLEIITPEKRILDTEVDSVTLPTASGEASILQSHAPLISALSPGILVYASKSESGKLAVSSGFVEVNSDRVAVLVDTAENPAEIDTVSAQLDRDNAEKAIAAAGLIPADQAGSLRDTLEHASTRLRLAAAK